ncbi:MAG: leucine-rich repeat protein [Clostridia bacterium]|nr:leucine-rich repeat protein [Clostridia bacterium]
MSKIKKLVYSLSVAVTMAISFVIGVLGNENSKPSVINDVPINTTISTSTVTNTSYTYTPIKPQKFSFRQDEVSIQQGSIEINFDYQPSVNVKATSVAYEYKFSNPMNKLMAVNLKAIDTTGVTVSYAYSDTQLSSVTSTSTPFEAPTIASKSAKYIYIVVSATSSIPTTFTSSIVWYQGEAGELSITANGDTETQTVVKGQPVEQSTLVTPTIPEGYSFGGWYLDEACTIVAPSTFNAQGQTLYAKVEEYYPDSNLPSDWLALNDDGVSYSVVKGTSTLPTTLVIPKTHNGLPVTSIADCTGASDSIFNGKKITHVTIPNTIKRIGSYAFAASGNQGQTVVFANNSQLEEIGDYAWYMANFSGTLPASVNKIGTYAFTYAIEVNLEDTDGWYYTTKNTYTGGTLVTNTAYFSALALGAPTYDSTLEATLTPAWYWYK